MFRFRRLVLASCVLALSAWTVHAQENADLRAVINKAIQAQGGKENLAKYNASTLKIKGTMELMGKTVPMSGEITVQRPDKMKNMLSMEINDKTIDLTQVFDGKKFWIHVMGKTMEIADPKLIKETREGMIAEQVANLVTITNDHELSAIGDVKIKNKNAIGIRVSKKGARDVSLFFDKQTYLLVKTEMRVVDAMSGQEVTQEKFFSDYKEAHGLKTPRHIVVHKDGNPLVELDVTEMQVFEKLDDSTFAMP